MLQDATTRANWIRRVLGVEVTARTERDIVGLDVWKRARTAAFQDLATLEAAVRHSGHPEVGPAVILLRAIRANLPVEPDTLRAVDGLIRYLATDDIIATAERPNALGVSVSLRRPLLRALAGLRDSLKAGAAA